MAVGLTSGASETGRARRSTIARMATIGVKDVAAHAGVSVGTVSNVLNHPDKVSDRTVRKVRASIEALGFVRNDAARQLRAGRSTVLGLVVLDMQNPFFAGIARGAADVAAEAGLSVLVADSDTDEVRERRCLALFEEQRAFGVLWTPLGEAAAQATRLRERGLPIVLVDRSGVDLGVSSVAVDDVAGGHMAVAHLVSSGRRRIAFVGATMTLSQIADRLTGARQATADEPDVHLEVVDSGGLSVAAGRSVGEQLAARPDHARPDGVFTANDLLALGLLQALVEAGLRVPQDVAVVGYDDIDFAQTSVVPLTSVEQPSRLIGRTAAEILISEASQTDIPPRHVLFQPQLRPRQTSAPTRSPRSSRTSSRIRLAD